MFNLLQGVCVFRDGSTDATLTWKRAPGALALFGRQLLLTTNYDHTDYYCYLFSFFLLLLSLSVLLFLFRLFLSLFLSFLFFPFLLSPPPFSSAPLPLLFLFPPPSALSVTFLSYSRSCSLRLPDWIGATGREECQLLVVLKHSLNQFHCKKKQAEGITDTYFQ